NQPGTTYNPGTLSPNTTYYWRIDEHNASATVTGAVWSFTTQGLPGQATWPDPPPAAKRLATGAVLTWRAGCGARSHNVYFGTTDPPASAGNRVAASFDPGMLARSQTYYWR